MELSNSADERECRLLASESTTTDADTSIPLENSTKHVNDLGLYYTIAQSPSDDRKLELLKNSWTPPRSYNFPKTHFYGKIRAFCFEWLTQFCAKSGNKVLANHFANGPRNAIYRSKTIQNEIVEVLGTYI
ncbi:unnamed protein product [Pocillopora meandrina]|uniref:LAGLIDADG endonuclease n=1 Tax=Pocillopora meandrina TaxID=46732 RepID=A0AAU9Y4U7_9CNID|nr:unnamed protein product [Pocillopora meandrina]